MKIGLTGRGGLEQGRGIRCLWMFPVFCALWFLQPLTAAASLPRIFIEEFRIKGAHHLSRTEIEEAVYPFAGPGRTQDDVENARAALEKTYQAKGYQTVSVQIPAQPWQDGTILLEVIEVPVGRLRTHGARYYAPERIKSMAPSLAEGRVLNFNDVNRDVIALNQQADLRVTPSLTNATPGTLDVDLQVQDTFPLHGSLELNNRNSADSSALRLDGSISYANLWQLGHTLGGSFQVSPQDIDQVKVFSGYYLAPVPNVNWLSLMLQGTKQDSQVSTLGALAVAGRGEVVGLQSIMVLPGGSNFSHTVSLGLNYKRTEQATGSGPSNTTTTAYYYFPLSLTYSATWVTKTDQTELNFGPTVSFRGSHPSAFESSRHKADGNFMYLRGDLARTHELPAGFQLYGKIQGQISDQPLVSAEQLGGGGLGTVRGYHEGEVFGDNGIFGSLELRSPSLFELAGYKSGEWRVYAFAEAGRLVTLDPLPEQISQFDLASVGVGSRVRFLDHFNASVDLGIPVLSLSSPHFDPNTGQRDGSVYQVHAYDARLIFRLWATY